MCLSDYSSSNSFVFTFLRSVNVKLHCVEGVWDVVIVLDEMGVYVLRRKLMLDIVVLMFARQQSGLFARHPKCNRKWDYLE